MTYALSPFTTEQLPNYSFAQFMMTMNLIPTCAYLNEIYSSSTVQRVQTLQEWYLDRRPPPRRPSTNGYLFSKLT